MSLESKNISNQAEASTAQQVKLQRELLTFNLLKRLGTDFGRTVYEAKIATDMLKNAPQKPQE